MRPLPSDRTSHKNIHVFRIMPRLMRFEPQTLPFLLPLHKWHTVWKWTGCALVSAAPHLKCHLPLGCATAWETPEACAWSRVEFILEWDEGLLERLVVVVGGFTSLNLNAKTLDLLRHQRIVFFKMEPNERRKKKNPFKNSCLDIHVLEKETFKKKKKNIQMQDTQRMFHTSAAIQLKVTAFYIKGAEQRQKADQGQCCQRENVEECRASDFEWHIRWEKNYCLSLICSHNTRP